MRWSDRFRGALLFTIFFIARSAHAQLQTDEIGSLPTVLSSERFRAIASLSPFAELATASWSQDVSQRARSTKDSMTILRRQGLWPIRVETEDGAQYWGEITKIGANTFEVLNWKTNQRATLDYVTVRTVEIVKAYPRIQPPGTGQKTLQRTGEVLNIILLLPVRILEEIFIPRC